jgi:hypothetical protein
MHFTGSNAIEESRLVAQVLNIEPKPDMISHIINRLCRGKCRVKMLAGELVRLQCM